MRNLQVDRVVVAFSKEPPERTVEVLRSLSDYDVQIDVVPRLFDVIGQRVAVHSVEALPMIGLPPVRLSRSSQFVKRLVDVVGSSVLIVLTLPIMLGAAVAVRLDSPGPAFFRQRRIGLHLSDRTERVRAWVVQVEDDELRQRAPHAGQRRRRRAGERNRHAEVRGGAFDFRREQQIVEDC